MTPKGIELLMWAFFFIGICFYILIKLSYKKDKLSKEEKKYLNSKKFSNL